MERNPPHQGEEAGEEDDLEDGEDEDDIHVVVYVGVFVFELAAVQADLGLYSCVHDHDQDVGVLPSDSGPPWEKVVSRDLYAFVLF